MEMTIRSYRDAEGGTIFTGINPENQPISFRLRSEIDVINFMCHNMDHNISCGDPRIILIKKD